MSDLPSEQPPAVWPPPPTNQIFPSRETMPLDGLESFPVQNVWLVLFLTVITLGIYPVFWLKRQIGILNRINPHLELPVALAYVVLFFVFLSAGLDVASWFNDAASLDSVAKGLDRISELMLLILSFLIRNGLNKTLQTRRSEPYWFSGLWTWLFGVVYLQYKINQNLKRRHSEPHIAGVS